MPRVLFFGTTRPPPPSPTSCPSPIGKLQPAWQLFRQHRMVRDQHGQRLEIAFGALFGNEAIFLFLHSFLFVQFPKSPQICHFYPFVQNFALPSAFPTHPDPISVLVAQQQVIRNSLWIRRTFLHANCQSQASGKAEMGWFNRNNNKLAI